jgi:hypothetical protein
MVVPALGWITVTSHTLAILTMMGGLHRASPLMVQSGAALFTLAILTTGAHHIRLMLVK